MIPVPVRRGYTYLHSRLCGSRNITADIPYASDERKLKSDCVHERACSRIATINIPVGGFQDQLF